MRSVGHQTPGNDERALFESLGFKVEALLREIRVWRTADGLRG